MSRGRRVPLVNPDGSVPFPDNECLCGLSYDTKEDLKKHLDKTMTKSDKMRYPYGYLHHGYGKISMSIGETKK